MQKTAKYAVDEVRAQRANQVNLLEANLVAKYYGLQLALSLQKLRDATLQEEND